MPAAPAAATPVAVTGAAAAPRIALTRQRTSKKRLRIRWDYPVYVLPREETVDPGQTIVRRRRQALSREEAFRQAAGDDPRPLLVLRECPACVGSEVALLSRKAENDRTLLFSQWFHCLKLPPDVLLEEHPFRRLFPEKDPPHLFLAMPDGSGVVGLSGAQSQKELWQAMTSVLRQAYVQDPSRAVKDHLKLLARFDHLDSREDLLEEQIDLEIEKRGPRSPKVRRLGRELEKIRAQRREALEREKEITALELREPDDGEG